VTYMDVIVGMDGLGLPCAYHSWKQPPPPPYTVILHTANSDFIADNHNYQCIGNYQLELYTAIKHPPSEKKVEQWLKDHRIPYDKTEVFLDSEDMFQVVYDIQLIGG